jgi:hypothetical protein
MLSPVGDHILQEFNTQYLTRFRTSKINPKQKPQTDKHLSQSAFTCIIFQMTTFCIALYQSIIFLLIECTGFSNTEHRGLKARVLPCLGKAAEEHVLHCDGSLKGLSIPRILEKLLRCELQSTAAAFVLYLL